MSDRSPTLAQVLARAIAVAREGLRVSVPAQVTRFDAAKQLVDVQPTIQIAHQDEEGNRVVEALPVIVNCPVQYPGAGLYRLVFPLAVGDTGLLVFCDVSTDKWVDQGGIVDPGVDHRNVLVDAFFIPGVRDTAHALTAPPTTAINLGVESGAFVQVEAAAVRLNTVAGQLVALANKVEAELGSQRTWASTHVHGAAGTPPTTAPPAVGSVGAVDVFAKE